MPGSEPGSDPNWSGLEDHRPIQNDRLAISVTRRPIHDQESLTFAGRDQWHVPGSAMIVNALFAVGHERLEIVDIH